MFDQETMQFIEWAGGPIPAVLWALCIGIFVGKVVL